jgi:streptogramin lyase
MRKKNAWRWSATVALLGLTLAGSRDATAQPSGATCSTGNGVFTTSYSASSVSRLDASTGQLEYGAVQTFRPIQVVGGPDSLLYVTTFTQNSVVRMDPATGEVVGTFTSDGGIITAVGITFGPDGNLYVGSRDTSSVVRFDGSTGTLIDTFVDSGSGGLSAPESLLFGPDGNLYVTEFSGSRVMRYDGATGAFIDVFASHNMLRSARGMIFHDGGAGVELLVAGYESGNIIRFHGGSGAFVGAFASGISGANGLTLGPDGHLYVAAEVAGEIQRFNACTGQLIDVFAMVAGPIGIWFGLPTPHPSADLNGDGKVNLLDFAEFQRQFDGVP